MDEAVENFVDIELEYGYKKAEFYSLDTSEKRFLSVYRHFNIFSFDKFKDKSAKSLETGQIIKNRGNEMFGSGHYKRALKLYSESITILSHRSENTIMDQC